MSIQYHPEASPGPHDADICFEQVMLWCSACGAPLRRMVRLFSACGAPLRCMVRTCVLSAAHALAWAMVSARKRNGRSSARPGVRHGERKAMETATAARTMQARMTVGPPFHSPLVPQCMRSTAHTHPITSQHASTTLFTACPHAQRPNRSCSVLGGCLSGRHCVLAAASSCSALCSFPYPRCSALCSFPCPPCSALRSTRLVPNLSPSPAWPAPASQFVNWMNAERSKKAVAA